MIGKMTVEPELLPHTGDRDDYIVVINGPEPATPEMRVPFSFTGSVLEVWDLKSSEAVEEIARTIFGGGKAVLGTRGTASGFPPQGYWFDSYNSGETLRATINKILNEGEAAFIKNRSTNSIYGVLVGQETGDILEKIDKYFNTSFEIDFFKRLDEVFALSEIAETLTEPPKDNPNFLYKISLLSCIIDAIHVRLPKEKGFYCSECRRTVVGILEALNNWLATKIGGQKAENLVMPLKMIKKIRNQFPIHNHYELKGGIRVAKKEIIDAISYFKLSDGMGYTDKWHRIIVKFNTSLLDIIAELKEAEEDGGKRGVGI